MCQSTNHIRLCSCSNRSVPPNNWSLHRYDGKKEVCMMGDLIPWENWPNHDTVKEHIKKELNTGNSFDFETKFVEKDILVIAFADDMQERFYFQYRKGKWVESDTENHFDIDNKYRKIKRGEIQADIDAFRKL